MSRKMQVSRKKYVNSLLDYANKKLRILILNTTNENFIYLSIF